MLWRLVPGQALLQRAWGEQHAVYNNLTGDTHLLPADAMQILFMLRAAPLSQDALIAAVRASLDVDDGSGAGTGPDRPTPNAQAGLEPALDQDVSALLDELAALDLVERTGC